MNLNDDRGNAMADAQGGKLEMPQQRSPAYPYIGLDLAVERAKRLYAAVRELPQPREVLAKAYGKPATSSATIQTFATLLQYGLLENVVGPSGRKMKITPLAQAILNPHAPQDKIQLGLQKAALNPPIFSELWDKFGDATDLNDNVVLYYLTQERAHEHGSVFTHKGAQDVLRVYRASLSFAGHGVKDGIQVSDSAGSTEKNSPPAGRMGEFAPESAPPTEEPAPEEGSGGNAVGRTVNIDQTLPRCDVEKRVMAVSETKEEKTYLDEGEAKLILPEILSPESVDDLEYWLRGILRKARRRAGLAEKDW